MFHVTHVEATHNAISAQIENALLAIPIKHVTYLLVGQMQITAAMFANAFLLMVARVLTTSANLA